MNAITVSTIVQSGTGPHQWIRIGTQSRPSRIVTFTSVTGSPAQRFSPDQVGGVVRHVLIADPAAPGDDAVARL
jgi:hypothetical protein